MKTTSDNYEGNEEERGDVETISELEDGWFMEKREAMKLISSIHLHGHRIPDLLRIFNPQIHRNLLKLH